MNIAPTAAVAVASPKCGGGGEGARKREVEARKGGGKGGARDEFDELEDARNAENAKNLDDSDDTRIAGRRRFRFPPRLASLPSHTVTRTSQACPAADTACLAT